MKKIINGKKYDTFAATEVCSYDNGCTYSDFNFVEEVLFLKNTGEFFIYGKGGPASKYSERCGSIYCGGSEIKPVTIEEAKAFFERHGDADEYEKFFGEVEE